MVSSTALGLRDVNCLETLDDPFLSLGSVQHIACRPVHLANVTLAHSQQGFTECTFAQRRRQ
jgi:hypothetical protein